MLSIFRILPYVLLLILYIQIIMAEHLVIEVHRVGLSQFDWPMVDVQSEMTGQPIHALDVRRPSPRRFERRSVRIIDRVPPGPVQFAKLGSLSCISCEPSLCMPERSCSEVPSGPCERKGDKANPSQNMTKDACSSV